MMNFSTKSIIGRLILCVVALSSPVVIAAQTWAAKANYPVAAGGDGAVTFELNGQVFVGGGLGSRQFWRYDPPTGQWLRRTDIPGVTTDRSFGLAFAINGKGYVGFGLDGSTELYDLWEYDAAGNKWTRKHDFPGHANDGLFCFALNNKAYIGCGEQALSLQQTNEVYAYDPALDSWAPKHAFPTAGLIYPFSFAVNGKGYVACGADANAEVKKTFEYDPAGDSWTPRSAYPGSPRQAGVSFVLNGKAWCGLGMDQAGFFKSFYSYNAASDRWAAEADFPDSSRSFPVAVSAGGAAFAGLGWSLPNNLYKGWWQLGTPTGVAEQSIINNLPVVYPNPVVDILQIVNLNPANSKLSLKQAAIYDNDGRLVMKLAGDFQGNAIDVHELPAGTYTLRLPAGNPENIHSIHFIKINSR